MNRLDTDMIAKSIARARKSLDCDPAYIDAVNHVVECIAFDIWVQSPLFDREEFTEKTKENL